MSSSTRWATSGARNDHYIFDNATFELPLGLLLVAAVRWPTWRVPALAFATLHWALHALSHIIDTHHGAGDWVGLLEFGGLAVTTVLLAIALRYSMNDEKAGGADAGIGGRCDERAGDPVAARAPKPVVTR